MFLELNELFSCPGCREEFSETCEAVILPCDIYCRKCVQNMLNLNFEEKTCFICPWCKDEHEVPEKGFAEFRKFHKVESLKNVVMLNAAMEHFEKYTQNFDEYFKKHSQLLREECDLERRKIEEAVNSMVEKVQKLGDAQLAELDEYEQKLLESLKNDLIVEREVNCLMTEILDSIETFKSVDENALTPNFDESESNKSENLKQSARENTNEMFDLDENEIKGLEEINHCDLELTELSVVKRNEVDIEYCRIDTIFPLIDLKFQPRFLSLKDGKFLVAFVDSTKKLNILLLNVEKEVFQTWVSPEDNIVNFLLETLNNRFVLFYELNDLSFMPFTGILAVLNKDLSVHKTKVIYNRVNSIALDDVNIYCNIRGQINIYDWNLDLDLDHLFGQSNHINLPFYIPKKPSTKVAIRNFNFYAFDNHEMRVMNKKTGVVSSNFDFKGEEFCFDCTGNFLTWPRNKNKIYRYQNDTGLLIEEIVLNSQFICFTVGQYDDILVFT